MKMPLEFLNTILVKACESLTDEFERIMETKIKLIVLILICGFIWNCSPKINDSPLVRELQFESYRGAYEKGNPTDRYKAIIQLLNLQDAKTFQIFLQAIDDPDPMVRYAAAWAATKSIFLINSQPNGDKIEDLGPIFLSKLSDIDPWVKSQKIELLQEFEKFRIAFRIKTITKDETSYSRSEIAEALNLSEEQLDENISSIDSIPNIELKFEVGKKFLENGIG